MFVCSWHQSEQFIWGLPSSTAVLQYTNVTDHNQSGSSWDRPPGTPFLGFHPGRYSFWA